MHGAVRVESSPAGGARFVLSLPVLSNGSEPEGRGVRRRIGALAAGPGRRSPSSLAGCAIPTQSAPSTIASSKVPFGLLDPHPPTTTTTQPKPSSFVPVKVFFLNSSEPAEPAARCVASPAPLSSIITAMLAGPTTAEAASGIFTAIPSDVTVL